MGDVLSEIYVFSVWSDDDDEEIERENISAYIKISLSQILWIVDDSTA